MVGVCGLDDSYGDGRRGLNRVAEGMMAVTFCMSRSRDLKGVWVGDPGHGEMSSTASTTTGSCQNYLNLGGGSRIRHPRRGRCGKRRCWRGIWRAS